MKKYISEFIALTESFINGRLESASEEEVKAFLRELEQKILYFQHERLIHLIVTVLFALMETGAIYAFFITGELTLILLCVMFLVLLVPYVMHYYFLENSVQKLYKLRDRINERIMKDRTN